MCETLCEPKFIWRCSPKTPGYSLTIYNQFSLNLPVSSWEQDTAIAPESPKLTQTHPHLCQLHLQPLITHTQLTPELQLPKSHTHTYTHGSVMYAGHIWAAAEQKHWTLCGLIAGKIMSRGERRSHYCGARLSPPQTLVQSDHYSIMSHYREKNKHHPSTWMYKHPPERRWTTDGAGELTSTLAC